jgi:hypothetical protein
MRLLKPVFLYLGGQQHIPTIGRYQEVLEAINIKDSDFTTDKYLPGTSGESMLYKDLMSELNISV